MTFLPTLPSGDDNSERELNPIPQSPYIYLSGSGFLANFTPPNKQSFKVKFKFKSCDMYLIHKKKKNILVRGVKVAVFCFKQLPLNIKQKCESLYHLVDEEGLVSVVVRVL